MSVPPIILEPSLVPPPEREEPESRNPWGWIALAFLFAVTLWGALSGSLDPKGSQRYLAYDSELKSIVSSEALEKTGAGGGLSALGDGTPKEELAALEAKLAPDRQKDNLAQALYVAVLTEEHRPVASDDLARLRKGKLDSTRAMADVYGASKLSLAQANALARRLPADGPFVTRLARVHAFEKASDNNARARLIPPPDEWKIAIVFMLFLVLICAFLPTWFLYFIARANGYLEPLGLKNGAISGRDADRLALRAAQLFAGFLLLGSTVPLFFGKSVDSPVSMLVESVLMVAFAFGLAQTPVMGRRVGFADLGIEPGKLGEHVLWGIAGCCAELPLAMILGVLVIHVLKFLPPPEHPAATELQNNHDPMTIIAVLVFGAIVAPFWEEMMFRGLLFPALSRVSRNVLTGAIVSSVIFASIHPQGITLWLALATTGLMSCFLSRQTRSLVPSIVMHACHNAILLAIASLIT